MENKYVKCLICGAVFSKETTVCPICGVGSENFLDIEKEEETIDVCNTEENILILGQGIAAISAATTIRERNKTAKITMITDENHVAINRPLLTKEMLGSINSNKFFIHSEDWYSQNKIELFTCETVTKLDPIKQEVATDANRIIKYDKCIYALGAYNFVPPFEGAHLPEVISIRTLDDIRAIQHIIKSNPNEAKVVIIGGGILGLEAALTLYKDGNNVTILENTTHLLSKQIDISASKILEGILAKEYIKVVTLANVQKITGINHVTGVELDNGTFLDADLVIVSCGIRANVQVAKEAGIEINRAIKVNKFMQTNFANIYACGDCCEYEGNNYALWSEAEAMGIVAGKNVCNEKTEYHYQLPPVIINNFLYASGDLGYDKNLEYKVIEYKNATEYSFSKYFYLNTKLVGFVLIGDLHQKDELIQALDQHLTYQEVNQILNNK